VAFYATYDAYNSTYSPQTTAGDSYSVKPYPAGAFLTNGQAYAISAIQMERRLELAMEGQRFFDLAKYDNGTGSIAATLNAYVSVEKKGAAFIKSTVRLSSRKRPMNILPHLSWNSMRKTQRERST
jgi:hypothetical protein